MELPDIMKKIWFITLEIWWWSKKGKWLFENDGSMISELTIILIKSMKKILMIEKHIKVDYIIHFKGIIIFDEFLEKGEKLTFHSINELFAILNQKCE